MQSRKKEGFSIKNIFKKSETKKEVTFSHGVSMYDAEGELLDQEEPKSVIVDTPPPEDLSNTRVDPSSYDNVKEVMKQIFKGKTPPKEDIPPFDEEGNILQEDHTEEFDHYESSSEAADENQSSLLGSVLKKFDVFFKHEKEEKRSEKKIKPVVREELVKLDDFKHLAKISANILKKLPPDQLEAFKRGMYFKEYKDLLTKYKIIK